MPGLATAKAADHSADRQRRAGTREAGTMTRDQQIAAARSALDFARKFRAGIEELTHGPAKPALLAKADATIANGELILARLEHASAPLSATLPAPTGRQ